jgi:hypothetical protein
MTDVRLRDRLEGESHRVSLAPGASDRMFERRAHRERRRRVGAAVVGLVLVAGVTAVAVTTLSSRDRGRNVVTDASDVAGTYRTRLPSHDPDVARFGADGFFDLTLSANGDLALNGPWDFGLPGPPTTFSIRGDELTTDLLVGFGCDADGTYRWSLADGALTLTPLDDACQVRSVLLGTRPWGAFDPGQPVDALQGDWTATFTCDEMVAAVDRAPISAGDEKAWLRREGEIASDDPSAPCAGSPAPIEFTLRFTGDRLLIFGADRNEGFDGRYALDGDVLTIRDPRTRNIAGAYRLRVTFGADALTFTLLGDAASDAFFTATWEAAPFVRRP